MPLEDLARQLILKRSDWDGATPLSETQAPGYQMKAGEGWWWRSGKERARRPRPNLYNPAWCWPQWTVGGGDLVNLTSALGNKNPESRCATVLVVESLRQWSAAVAVRRADVVVRWEFFIAAVGLARYTLRRALMSSVPMIEVRNLTKRYAGHTALADISFSVARGDRRRIARAEWRGQEHDHAHPLALLHAGHLDTCAWRAMMSSTIPRSGGASVSMPENNPLHKGCGSNFEVPARAPKV